MIVFFLEFTKEILVLDYILTKIGKLGAIDDWVISSLPILSSARLAAKEAILYCQYIAIALGQYFRKITLVNDFANMENNCKLI